MLNSFNSTSRNIFDEALKSLSSPRNPSRLVDGEIEEQSPMLIAKWDTSIEWISVTSFFSAREWITVIPRRLKQCACGVYEF